jgi:hypothetical protein
MFFGYVVQIVGEVNDAPFIDPTEEVNGIAS